MQDAPYRFDLTDCVLEAAATSRAHFVTQNIVDSPSYNRYIAHTDGEESDGRLAHEILSRGPNQLDPNQFFRAEKQDFAASANRGLLKICCLYCFPAPLSLFLSLYVLKMKLKLYFSLFFFNVFARLDRTVKL